MEDACCFQLTVLRFAMTTVCSSCGYVAEAAVCRVRSEGVAIGERAPRKGGVRGGLDCVLHDGN